MPSRINVRLTRLCIAVIVFVPSAIQGSEAPDSHPSQPFWSLAPIKVTDPPETKLRGWSRSPIDSFILARLETAGMKPALPADRTTLLRRVYFDLIGLPPTPADVADFVRDDSPNAYEKVVERLLDSPRYGEHWARHWLDIVHYAETHGHDQDRVRTNAWPYRDYVIRSFNQDKPYARFVEEQIAGDVLFPEDPQAIVAMGFLATGPWDESSLRDIRDDTIDRQIARYLDRDDIVTTVMNTFVSTTAQCARCHNHKFDPITQEEYYGLQAVFASTDKGNRFFDPDPKTHELRRTLRRREKEIEKRTPAVLAEIGSLEFQSRLRTWEKSLSDGAATPISLHSLPDTIARILALPATSRTPVDQTELSFYFLKQEVERALSALPAPRLVYAGASDYMPDGSFKPAPGLRPVHLLQRGDINRPGALAAPGALSCVTELPSRFDLPSDNEGARRSALARWIIDRRNPLTWRSIANRVWHYHFGRGIVDSPNDFGRMGSVPSHPELLDWIAAYLLTTGGSIKDLDRLIVTSATYRQSTAHNAQYAEQDADNRLLWRMNRTRLDAESVRDAVLQISGNLDLAMGGPSVQQFVMTPGIHVTPNVDYSKFNVDSPENNRRAIYRFIFRTLPDPFMDALDCADSSQLTAVRNVSVTPLQALTMMNNQFMVRESERFAARLEKANPDLESQINAAYQLALHRSPLPNEQRGLAAYGKKYGLANLCRLILNSNEFMFIN